MPRTTANKPTATKKKRTAAKKKAVASKKAAGLITKDMLMGEILEKHPEAAEVLVQYGFHCIGCMISPYETLEAGAAVHGVPLESVLDDLNTVARQSKKG